MEKLITYLTEIENEYKCDEIKVYYINANDYCVKIIKNKKIVNCFRKGINRKKWEH